MSGKKTTIERQIDRAADLIDRRGATPDPADHSIRSTLRSEFLITDRSARCRIRRAVERRRVSEYHEMSNKNQIARTVAMYDALAIDENVACKVRLDAIKARESLLGLQPGNNGDPAPGAPQAAYAADPSVSSARDRDAAVARAREKATDNTDGGADGKPADVLPMR